MAFDYAGKIRSLLALSESERLLGNEGAADSAAAKAMRFMMDYNIAQEDAIAVDPTTAVPTHLLLSISIRDWSVSGHFPIMARIIAAHTGVKVHHGYGEGNTYVFTFVGYDLDLRYTEFLFTSAHLMFSTRITPVWDQDRSEAENIFFLRNAGIERREIADKAWGYGAGQEAKNRSKVQRIYLREAAARNEEARATGLGFNTRLYREAYADAFVTTLTRRLRVARDAADSTGGGLVLHGRSERVQAAYDELFPPAPKTDVKAYVNPTLDCVKCAKAKTTCNDHAAWRQVSWTKTDQARLDRRQYSPSAAAGRDSGRHAAEGVNVQRGHTTASRLDASGKAIEG